MIRSEMLSAPGSKVNVSATSNCGNPDVVVVTESGMVQVTETPPLER